MKDDWMNSKWFRALDSLYTLLTLFCFFFIFFTCFFLFDQMKRESDRVISACQLQTKGKN